MSDTEIDESEIFYHTSGGMRVHPSVMSPIHLENAIRSLEKKGETDAMVYNVLKKELEKRRKQ